MRNCFRKYQSVTNWFQNQRSLARKRAEDDAADTASVPGTDQTDDGISDSRPPSRMFTGFPPATSHPSLSSMSSPSPARRSHSDGHVPVLDHKLNALRRLGAGAPLVRPRRTRPEPYQLEALKKLFARTPNPSIEERGALALEIGM